MELNFKISFENYYEYNRIYAKMSLGKKINRIIFCGIVEIIAAAALLILALVRSYKPGTYLISAAVIIVGLFQLVYALVLFPKSLKREVTKKYRTLDYFKGERKVVISSEYVSTSSENDSDIFYYEDEVKEFIESKNLFMIMIRGRRGIIIPKSEETQTHVREILQYAAKRYSKGYRYIKG